MHALAPLAKLPGRSMKDLSNLPVIAVIYFVLRPGPTMLYIGQTRDLSDRWKRGGAGHHRAAQLVKDDAWLCWYEVDKNLSKAKFDFLERSLIRRYQPTLNDTRVPRQAVADTRPFMERQQKQRDNIMRTLRECGDLQAQIVAAEQAMDQQMTAARRWLRAYRNGLEDVLEQRERQQAQLNTALTTIRTECARFLPSIRSVKKAA